jgi:DNA-directed RNA polymerase subunit beta'
MPNWQKGLSGKALKDLECSGIDQLEDFNIFTLKELSILLSDSYEEIKSILRRYALPRNLDNLNLNQEIVDILRENGVEDFESLIENRDSILHLVEDDEYLLQIMEKFLAEWC